MQLSVLSDYEPSLIEFRPPGRSLAFTTNHAGEVVAPVAELASISAALANLLKGPPVKRWRSLGAIARRLQSVLPSEAPPLAPLEIVDIILSRRNPKVGEFLVSDATPPLQKTVAADVRAPAAPVTVYRRYILYDVDRQQLATTRVFDDYDQAVDEASRLSDVLVLSLEFEEYPAGADEPLGPSDEAALDKLIELGIASQDAQADRD